MFQKNLTWGVATAAYQIEGAVHEDDRGLSIWDIFSNDGNCFNGHTGNIACDHYHHFEEDVKLMKELGIQAYRFSISWTRIIPKGIGDVNEKGIAFYNKLIDCLLLNGITPYITLFHWDYPYELEIRGNWSNPDSPKWFLEYAKVVFSSFGDRVKHFITFNEPQCFIGMGYASGVHAPGLKCSNRDLVLKAHHILLAHGLAVQAFRELVPDGKIGYAPTCSVAIPMTNSCKDIEAAKKRYFDVQKEGWTWCVSWWSDPILLGQYPEDTEGFKALGKYLPATYKEDLNIISEPIDFYCQNIYTGYLISADEQGYKRHPNPIDTPITSSKAPVTPSCLYWGPHFLYERYHKPIIISENGMACHDVISFDEKIHDPNRIHYMQSYLLELQRAINDGIDITGYFYWSFMDNFEWKDGYSQRFGLVYVDYNNLKRIPKDSFYWYQNLITNNTESKVDTGRSPYESI